MNTWGKIAIGCGVAVVGIGVVAVVGVVGGGYWLKQKVGGRIEEFQAGQKQIDTYLRQARANPFTAPTNGVITEPELLKFLAVRKKVFPVYEKYGKELEREGKEKSGGLQGFSTMMGAINELRLAQAKAMAEESVNPSEYAYLIGAVYKTYYAAAIAKGNGGKSPSEVAAEASKQLDQGMPSAAPGSELAQQIEAAKRRFEEDAQKAQEAAKSMDVPPENLALFKKYDAEIQKYVMPGLEVVDAAFAGYEPAPSRP